MGTKLEDLCKSDQNQVIRGMLNVTSLTVNKNASRSIFKMRGFPQTRQNPAFTLLPSCYFRHRHSSASRPKKTAYNAKRHKNRFQKNLKGKEHKLLERPSSRNELFKILSSVPTVEVQPSAQVASIEQRSAKVAIDPEIQRTRRETLKIIPYFLSRDASWREQVMENLRKLLNPKLERAASKNVSWMRDARHWYQSSLTSFRERLDIGDYPHDVGLALDQLAEVGFSSEHFQENYQQVPNFRYRVSKLASQIVEQEQLYEKMKERVKSQKEQLEELQKQISDVLPETSAFSETVGDAKTFWETTVESFKTIFSQNNNSKRSSENERDLREKLEIEKHTERLLLRLKKKKKRLDIVEKDLADALSKLEQFRSARKSMQKPISDEVYERATKTVDSSRDAISSFLSRHIAERHKLILERYQVLDEKTDLTRPQEWFPYARLDRRKIIFHAGPTNSGKTFNALERLKEAKSGMYYGPLRLLAAEIYETLTAEGIYCNLYTGQERREIPFATHGAATVEMASIVDDFDVVVIDEIQMIADIDRGFAWTRALLGARCKEIHVCGGAEAEPILRKIATACGDDFEIITYNRFSALSVEQKSIAKSTDQREPYRNVKKGDCIVAFSRNDIFAIKREIERLTNFKCCIVYGSLPPQTRSEQARLFNDPESGYDILVASDAIGMGLNLNIRRIVFNTIYKNDGRGIVRLDHSAIKQISGRAGRRNSVFPDGVITCRSPEDLEYIRACIETDIEPIQRAGLLPTASHFETFNATLEEYGKSAVRSSMYTTLRHFGEMASIKNDYFLCRQTDMYEIAKAIDEYPIPIKDKYALCMCPVSTKNKKSMDVLKQFAKKMSAGEVSGLKNRIIPRKPKNFDDLAQLCGIFSDLDLFLWLQNKFPPGNVIEQKNASALKETAIRLIGEALEQTGTLRLKHCYISRDKQVRNIWRNHHKRKQSLHLQVTPGKGTAGDVSDNDGDWNRVSTNAW